MKNIVEISIIIPTYNRCNILEITLNSFLNINYKNGNYEIIIVDNNSTDFTKKIVEKFYNRLSVLYVFEKNQGKNYALNAGIKISKGDILVFTDDDVLVDSNWLSEIRSSTLRFPESDFFGGKILPLFPENTPEWMQTSEYSGFVYAIHDPVQGEGEYLNSGTPGGPNCWVRRSVFDAGNLFDTDIGPKGYGRISGSELEFFTRLRKKGIKPIYIPTAIVTHRIQEFQTHIKYLIKRSYASGRGIIYIQSDDKCPRVFGIPRYLFRQIIDNLIKALYFYIKLDIKSAFENIMIVAHRIGCIKQYIINAVNSKKLNYR